VTQEKIFIVTASESYFKQLAQQLEKYGYPTRRCETGQAALECIEEQKPRLILAELNLPEPPNGIELCWQIREMSQFPAIPFILLTDTKDDEIRINGLRSGVDSFVHPDISGRELITYIEALLKRFDQIYRQAQIFQKPLTGHFPEFTFLEILQLLHNSQKTGLLTIDFSRQTGKIGFTEGKITGAEVATSAGEDALAVMVNWANAYFQFEPEQRYPDHNMQRGTMEVILKCGSYLDEQEVEVKAKVEAEANEG